MSLSVQMISLLRSDSTMRFSTHSISNVRILLTGKRLPTGDNFEFWVGCPCDTNPTTGNGSHIAFTAPTQESVDEFYRIAIEQGGRCGGKPGLRPHYGKSYYAAYIFDLDGNKIEAVSC